MNRPLVKVCGVRELDNAMLLEGCGADMIGFNFVPDSPRKIDPAKAAEIVGELRPETKIVGVFRNMPDNAVRRIIETVGLDILQFHGDETPGYMRGFKLPMIRAFAVDEEFDASVLAKFAPVCAGFLFDAKLGGKSGGTGAVFPWELIRGIDLQGRQLWLAGGLGPYNLAAAVSEVQPAVVDLNSKIEKRPGFKDIELFGQCMDVLEKLASRD